MFFSKKGVKKPAASAVMAVMLLAFASFPLSAAGSAEKEAAGVRTVTDMRGREVVLPQSVDSIVALGACSLRLVSYLDASGMVVAVEDAGHAREKSVHDFFYMATYRIARPGYRELPSIGSAENHEGIIAAAPDLVISSAPDASQLDQLQEILGIPVFAVDADVELYDADRFNRQIEVLGTVLGKERRASELINGIALIMKDLEARSAAVTEKRTAYAGGMMYFGPADLFRTTGDYIPFDFTGIINVMPSNPAGNRQPYATSIENLVEADPDYIFIDAANAGLSGKGYTANSVLLDGEVSAFRTREVYTTLVYKYYGTNWENQLVNAYFAGKTVYPDLYRDIDPVLKAEEIWALFFGPGLDYDSVVSMHGPGLGRAEWW